MSCGVQNTGAFVRLLAATATTGFSASNAIGKNMGAMASWSVATAASALMRPLIEEFDRLVAKRYPAKFSRPTLGIRLTPGGIDPEFRDKVRRDPAKHLAARHAFMLANSAGFTTEVLSDATVRTTDNPEVVEVLEKLPVPNRATPVLQAPGPAIGILSTLLPHPEE